MASVGDRVLGQWEPEWFYPGVVIDLTPDGCVVRFDDGDFSSLRADQVRPLAPAAGQRVYGNWRGGGSYYPGRISSVIGHAIAVDYDDGDKEVTTMGMMRIHRDDA